MSSVATRPFLPAPKSACSSPDLDNVHTLADVYKLARFEKQIQPPPAILSSSTYQDHVPLPSTYSNRPTLPCFGVLINHGDVDEQESSPKRIRTTEAPEARSIGNAAQTTAKRQRGRPRLDSECESLSDKRRVQIRLAQRAYRDRKETTISELKGQVSDLQRNLDYMSRTFSRLQNDLYDSGLLNRMPAHHPVIQQLDKMVEVFADTRASSESGDDVRNHETRIRVGKAGVAV